MRHAVQHINDIEIPVIEITEGWAAEDCHTRQQCDDAFAYLMSAVAGIEFQVDMELIKPKPNQDREWLARANCALKYKRAALQIVNQKRSVINAAEMKIFQERRDRKLLEYIRSVVPDKQFLEWVKIVGVGEAMAETQGLGTYLARREGSSDHPILHGPESAPST